MLIDPINIYDKINKKMGKSIEEVYRKILEKQNEERAKLEEEERSKREMIDSQRKYMMESRKYFESLSLNSYNSSLSSSGGVEYAPSYETMIDTIWLYPIFDVDTVLEQYRGISPSIVENGEDLIFSTIEHLYDFYSDVYVQTTSTQPTGNAGYSLGVGTKLKDLSSNLNLKVDGGSKVVTWRLVEQLTPQNSDNLPTPGNSPDGTIGYIAIYTDWDEDGVQDPTNFNMSSAGFSNADPLRVKVGPLIRV